MVKYVVKTPPVRFRWIFTGVGREAFCVSGRLHCNSEKAGVQVVFARSAAQRLRRYEQGKGKETETANSILNFQNNIAIILFVMLMSYLLHFCKICGIIYDIGKYDCGQ